MIRISGSDDLELDGVYIAMLLDGVYIAMRNDCYSKNPNDSGRVPPWCNAQISFGMWWRSRCK